MASLESVRLTAQDVRKHRTPEDGAFELTVRCNLHCRMCFVRHDDAEIPELLLAEKSAPEWVDMAAQAARAGTLSLLITGGEPMLRDDFAEIWEGVNRIGFITQLYTNATLVTPDVLSLLKRYPPHRIGVTLYGASEETYEKVSGNGNAYRQAIEGIRRLSVLPSLLEFRTTLIKDNIGDLEKMEGWVKDNFGSERVLTHTKMVTKPVRGGSSDAEACRLEPEENIRLYFRRHFKVIEGVLGPDWRDGAQLKIRLKNAPEDESAPKRLSLFGCDAGMRNYAITYDGKMVGCQMLEGGYTEPFKVGFDEAWEGYPGKIRAAPEDPKCAACRDRRVCMSCAATRSAESGSPGGCARYICENTAEMAKYLEGGEEDCCEKGIQGSGCPF